MKLLIGRTVFVTNTRAYPIRIPANTVQFRMQTRDGTAWRFALTEEAVLENKESVWTVAANGDWHERNLNMPEPTTIYTACGTAGKILETLFWVSETGPKPTHFKGDER